MLLGTMLLILGLLVTAVAKDIAWFIIGRALQGSGAITGAAYAWIADNTPAEKRNRAMGIAGLAVGGAAIASFLGGLLLYSVLSVPKIFLVCAVLAGLVWLYVLVGVKEDAPRPLDASARAGRSDLFKNADLRRLIVAGFLVNYIFTAVCFVVAQTLGARQLWKSLIPAAVIGIIAMRVATLERRRKQKGPYRCAGAGDASVFMSCLPRYSGSARRHRGLPGVSVFRHCHAARSKATCRPWPSCARPTSLATRGVLHAVVREHLETFLREAAQHTEGTGLPAFVEDEFRAFLTCGVLAHGFARLRCDTCAFERLLPFSCKVAASARAAAAVA